ncbi:hypothetical protein SRHO_G00286350 [Serrasalmus rhombeus]
MRSRLSVGNSLHSIHSNYLEHTSVNVGLSHFHAAQPDFTTRKPRLAGRATKHGATRAVTGTKRSERGTRQASRPFLELERPQHEAALTLPARRLRRKGRGEQHGCAPPPLATQRLQLRALLGSDSSQDGERSTERSPAFTPRE